MLPKRLTLRNFLAYGEEVTLDFSGIQLASLTGANGAGKSSILDAITWALWGRSRAKRDEDLIHYGTDEMSVRLDFEQEGTLYSVIRRRARKSRSNSLDVRLRDQKDGWVSQAGKAAEGQNYLNDLLKLDYETFIHSSYLQQGMADRFMSLGPSERKLRLARILDLERWERYEKAAGEQAKTYADQIRYVEQRIREIDTDLAREPELQQLLATAQAAYEEANTHLQGAEAEEHALEHVPGDLRAARNQHAAQTHHAEQLVRELTALTKSIAERRADLEKNERVLLEGETIQAGYQALNEARQQDSDLSTRLQAVQVLDFQQSELMRQLDKARAVLEGETRSLQTTIDRAQKTVDAADPDAYADALHELEQIGDVDARRLFLTEQVQALRSEQSGLKATNTEISEQTHKMRARIDQLAEVQGAACPLCGQPLQAGHREHVMEQLENDGRDKKQVYINNKARLGFIEVEIADVDKSLRHIDGDNKRYQTLSQKATRLSAAMEQADEAARERDEAAARLATVQIAIEMGNYGADVRGALAALDSERVALGYDEAQHSAARTSLAQYQQYEQRWKDLERAQDRLPLLQNMLVETEANYTTKLEAQTATAAELERLTGEIAVLIEQETTYRERKQETAKLRAAERDADSKRRTAQQELAAIESQKKRRDELDIQAATARDQYGLYEDLRAAFSKTGVPTTIIETVVPELETRANELLGRMTDGRMYLTLRMQKENKDGSISETLDIDIADELGTRSYELYSGGETFRINFALRVALSQLLARRTGAHLRTLFIDEGFGTQDEDGRAKLVEAINAVQDDFSLILVITHLEDLRDAFPVQIQVEKTPSGSHIRMQ